MIEIDNSKLVEIESSFEEVFTSYNKHEKVATLKMLILLHIIKDFSQFAENESQKKIAQGKGGEVVFHKFLQLVSIHYLEKKSLKEYTNMLSVSPNNSFL